MTYRQSGFHVGRPRPLGLAWGLVVAVGLSALGSSPAAAGPGAPALQPAPVPMARAAFAALLMHLQRRSFGDEQLGVARDAIRRGHYFTCEQATQLMRATASGDAQVQLAATLYPRLVDPANFTALTATLAVESDRQKLRNLVGR